MANAEKIKVCIEGIQYAPDEKDSVVTTQIVEASFFQKGESRYLFYEERDEELGITTQARVKFKNGVLEVERKGPLSSLMVFEADKSYCTKYPTPYGTLVLDIHTTSVEILDETGGWPNIIVKYTLENQEEILGKYVLSMKNA